MLKAKRSTTTYGWDVVFLIINKHHHFELNANTIKDPGELEKMSRIVHNRNGGTLDGCIGALDGMAVKITKPSKKDASNALSYLNRKGYFSINLQAIADGNRKFLMARMATARGTHDSLAWRDGKLWHGEVHHYLVVEDR